MIDGCHNALAVLDDAKLVYALLKPGGWILFDDVENRITKQDHVKHGLQMFKEEMGEKITHLWKNQFMECYRKE